MIPATAMAKISMRLVPDQDPDTIAKLFEAFLVKISPKTVELKLTRMHGGRAWLTDPNNEFVQAAARAIEKGFGKAPVFTREGGSIPVYVQRAGDELAALQGEQSVYALVSFTAYLGPDRLNAREARSSRLSRLSHPLHDPRRRP